MNAPAKTNRKEVMQPADKEQLIAVLGQSLYVGVKPESIEMIIDYCQAAGLDVMQKPVHAVPMSVKNPLSGNYEWRDVIMPGIGLYRIQADRSKNMAGISEPEFGKEITKDFRDKDGNTVSVSFPEWCKVTAHKLVGDHIVAFVAKEYWEENYATAGKCTAPNAMWKKRPRGQIAKCAEAQALRKGWPEVGAAPTAEEMEGKTINGEFEVQTEEPKAIQYYPQADFDKNFDAWSDAVEAGKTTPERIISMISSKGELTEKQREKIEGITSGETA